jgi:polar amino acid transport system substrate-binding protein
LTRSEFNTINTNHPDCSMKTNRNRLLALATAFGWLLTSWLLPAQTVSFRADNWYPFNGTPGDAKPGYGVEVLKAVFEKSGGKVDYAVIPWKRAVSEAEKGAINGVIGALKSDTPDFVFPEEPIGMFEPIFFVRKDSAWKFTGMDSLKGKRLGILNGYSYGEKVDAYVKQNQGNAQAIDESTGDNPGEQAIRKLQAGRIDVFVEVGTVFWAQVAKPGLNKDDFMAVGQASDPEPIYVSFSPKKDDAKALAARLTTGIRELRSSGELAKILAKYEVKDWGK